jgi:putative tryptophan/tyrosine transport system substrate-binding protein
MSAGDRLSRRAFGAAAMAALGIAAAPTSPQAARRPSLGYLALGGRDWTHALANFRAFHETLRDLGWVPGRNLDVEYRFAEWDAGRLPELARELVQRMVDVIYVSQRPAIAPARDATKTIPIVFLTLGDPVAEGWVAALARPGGNLTGVCGQSPELASKRIELLREFAPALARIALLWNPSNRSEAMGVRAMENVARSFGVTVVVVGFSDPSEFERGVAAVGAARVDAVVVLPDPMLAANAARLAPMITRWRLPAIYTEATFAAAGGLMTYSPSLSTMNRRAAHLVHKILRGAKPADLPVEQPTKFELIVNLKTAKAIGVTVPDSILLRADEVIE